jgi:phage gp37-like protein
VVRKEGAGFSDPSKVGAVTDRARRAVGFFVFIALRRNGEREDIDKRRDAGINFRRRSGGAVRT